MINGIVPPYLDRTAIHIVPYGDAWAVKDERFRAYLAITDTQAEALGLGVSMARESQISLIIHGRDGRFREVWNYQAYEGIRILS